MYEILLKWGLENLRKVASDRSQQEFSVMLEAIKTKNVLVVERFKYAWTSCQSIVDLSVKIEEKLPEFLENSRATDGTEKSTKQFLGDLQSQFHPNFYRKLTKLRSQFDATNDLLSAYSSVFRDVLHFKTIGDIAINKQLSSGSDLIRLYRGLWSFYSRIMTTLLRVTSSDLRFWITDQPYIQQARNRADNDWEQAKQYLLTAEGFGIRYYLSLETNQGLDYFWKKEQLPIS